MKDTDRPSINASRDRPWVKQGGRWQPAIINVGCVEARNAPSTISAIAHRLTPNANRVGNNNGVFHDVQHTLRGDFWESWEKAGYWGRMMSNYRRWTAPGRTYFFTVVTYQRIPWLCEDIARKALREGIQTVQDHHPFGIDAMVLLPDHLHCLWTLPEGDADYAMRWRLIKSFVTRCCAEGLALDADIRPSRRRRGEHNLWQRRFWEHLVRDRAEFDRYVDYIHHNPVKHGLCAAREEWPFSTIHRLNPPTPFSDE
jgi:putative transposase